MNNIKKLGLTALAGSLVATSAYAGSLDVSGGASITYKSNDETEVNGNGFTMGDGITFSGSGDLDNGMTMSFTYIMDAAGTESSHSIALDMGDNGTLKFGQGGYGGLEAHDSKVPNAKEEAWDDLDGEANGQFTHATANTWAYNNSWGSVGVSAAYTQNGSGNASDSSWVLTYSDLVDGLVIGFGMGEDGTASDDQTIYATYAIGGVSLGWQKSDIDYTASTSTDDTKTDIGVSFAVNEDLSLSWGQSETDLGGSSQDQEDTGFSASYTMGSITVAAAANPSDNVGGVTTAEDSMKEVTVTFAF